MQIHSIKFYLDIVVGLNNNFSKSMNHQVAICQIYVSGPVFIYLIAAKHDGNLTDYISCLSMHSVF